MENIETLLAAVAQTQGFDFDEQPVSSTASPELGLRNSAGGIRPVEFSGDVRASAAVNQAAAPEIEKKKRGRPARGQLGARVPVPKRKKEVDEDEDVCFICFDGGSLVLCDRKGCPKAYHPACIKRDEAFFQSKAKWTCGWHICSVCRKASHYLCYTCTYSLCKGCTKDADYLCVRGNKGFCSTCMKTIMLLENKDQANSDSVQVDFDDKTSWEYLFKVYWVYVKEKLSLTLTELTHAKKPWKGVTTVPCKPQISNVHHSTADGKVSISCSSPMDLEQNKLHEQISLPQNDRLRTSASVTNNLVVTLNDAKGENAICFNREAENPSVGGVMTELNIDKGIDEPGIEEAAGKPASEHEGDNSSIVKDTDRPCVCRNRDEAKDQHPDKLGSDIGTEWASKDLLEFVAHMKNGDTSALSQFDVQTLLLDYIKKNNLRDPRRKSQIVCDLRLSNLFGKPRVGHIEMLKLLEYHFVVKDSQKNSFIPAGFVGSAATDLEVDGKKYGSSMPINSRKRKSRKKSEERAPQDNLNEYAAIDFHNINLIYLRRNLMENFIEDKENFNDKVVGSIVRIRISSNDQKPEIYRLVQVVGTSKGPESYEIGDKTADIMLEVLNLDKKEVISIDTLSNQEFTEDECRRLRQSIRCGLMKQFSVGEIQKKAMELQPVRVNDWLQAETERLNHLRDRASEKGRKKELRECIQKLQLLKSPEERQRRVSEVPYIHTDPKMNPNYESEEETRSGENSKEDENVRPSHSGFTQTERKTISSNKKGKEDSSSRVQYRVVEKIDVSGSRGLRKQKNQINATKSAPNCGIDQAAQRSGLETSTATASVGNSPPANSIETEKLWHYRDPNAKIQGPFSMMQLRKWNTTGLFPPDMRIWTNHEQYDSLLLTDALNGHFHGASKLPDKHTSAEEHRKLGVRDGVNETGKDGKQIDTASCNRVSDLSDCNTGFLKTDKSSFKLPEKHTSANEHKEFGGRECVNEAGKDGKQTETASCNHVSDFSDGDTVKTEKSSSPARPQCLDWVREGVNEADNNGNQTETASCKRASDISDGNTVKTDKSSSPAQPQCLDLLKDKNSSASDVQACNVLPSSSLELNSVAPSDRGEESGGFNHCSEDENDSSAPTENQMTSGDELQNQSNNHVQTLLSSEEKLRSLTIELFSNDVESESALASIPESAVAAVIGDMGVLNLPSHTTETCHKHMGVQINENQQSKSSDVPVQTSGILELLSPTPRSNDEDQKSQATEPNQSQLTDFPIANPGPSCSNSSTLIAGTQIPEVADEWCGYSPTPAKPTVQEWDFALGPPEVTSENVATSTLSNGQLPHASNLSNWMFMDGPIEFDALGEESVSDLLAEVDAMESQGNFPSPTSAMKFAKELIEDCKDDCFSSIEFNPIPHPAKTDAMSSTGDNQSTSQASMPYKSMGATPIDAFDSFKRSDVHSSTSSVGETNASGYSGESGSEFHPPAPNNTNQEMVRMTQAPAPGMGSESAEPGWGTVQGNINLVTVQGNVNLVLGGPGQGMPNLGWGNNPGTGWVNPNLNCRYGGERYPSPREWGYQGGEAGFGRGRAPWGRQPYGGGGGGGGGYLRPPPKGQRVCKFYESGRCRKGAFCDYLHP